MVFFTRLGAYSATRSPAMAGTSIAMPRAWPSLSVAVASLLTKVASTAASSGTCSATTRCKPPWIDTSRTARPARQPSVERNHPHGGVGPPAAGKRAAGDEAQPVAFDRHHPPAGAAEPRID